MKIAICDDKMPFHNSLKKHLDQYAFKHNLSIDYYDYMNGSDLIASNIEHDLIFLDYQMDGIDGLETARRLRKKNTDVTIVFLTSYPHVVFDAFEVNAYRFLVKPIDMEKLSATMDSFLQQKDDDHYIMIKTDDTNKRLNIDDIVYVEAAGKYCYIRVRDESLLYKNTLSDIEKMLPADKFFRPHRTYLVGFRHIVSHTSTEIIFDNNERAVISKMKLSSFRKAFTDYIKRYNF
jgi:DNA-binding LytR/AlgR family response regulator